MRTEKRGRCPRFSGEMSEKKWERKKVQGYGGKIDNYKTGLWKKREKGVGRQLMNIKTSIALSLRKFLFSISLLGMGQKRVS